MAENLTIALIAAVGGLIGAIVGGIISPLINGRIQKKEIFYKFSFKQKKIAYEKILKMIISILHMLDSINKESNINNIIIISKGILEIPGKIPPLAVGIVDKKVKIELHNYLIPLSEGLQKLTQEKVESKNKIVEFTNKKISEGHKVRDNITNIALNDLRRLN